MTPKTPSSWRKVRAVVMRLAITALYAWCCWLCLSSAWYADKKVVGIVALCYLGSRFYDWAISELFGKERV